MYDLISRKAAIEACLEIARQEHDEKDPLAIAWANGVRHAARVILPTIDAVPAKHGRWIENEGFDGDCYYTCSVCKCDWTMIDGTPTENNMRYCPECGAKMD